MNSPIRLTAVLAAATLHLACASSDAPAPPGDGLTVAVVPSEATLPLRGQAPFAAVVTGPDAISKAVTWAVQEGSPAGGTITPTATGATYTAPASFGTFRVVATSVASPAVSGTATVRVEDAVDVGDVPDWMAALPTLANGLKWNPGVPGGIPTGTLDTTLTAAQMTASAINSAISAASGRGSPTNLRVVALPAGTFAISGTITPRNYVILRGAGPWGAGRTRLNFGSSGGVESADTAWGGVPLTAMALPVGGTLPIGSTSVEVASATGFAVGDLIQLDQLDDLSYVWILDGGYNKRAPFTDGPYHGPISTGGFRSVTSVHQVTAVSGTTLTFDPPTRVAYTYYSASNGTTRLNPQVWRVSRRGTDGLWHFGLEGVSIAGPQTGAIIFHAGAFDWILDVETGGSANGGITDDHVRFEHQFRSEIRRLYAHHTRAGPYAGGANYGVNLNASTSETLVIDSISVLMNKPMQTNCAGPGNVMAYNYVDDTSANGGDWMDGAINGSHQSFTHHLLVEGNWAANIGCDTTHGNSGYMAFLRNYAHGRSSTYPNGNNLRAANSDAWQREMAFAGNVLSTVASGTRVYEATGPVQGDRYAIWSVGQNSDGGSGDAYDGQTTRPQPNAMSYGGTTYDSRQPTFTTKAADKLWRHGNWDAINGSVSDWNPVHSARQVAASYFLNSAPPFFGARPWPWIEATGATAAARVGTLPAKARYDAGAPFAP
jgi:hypothetical protein